MGPTFSHSWTWPTVYSPLPPNPVTSIRHPWIFLSEIPTACKVLNRMRFTKASVSTKALFMGIWFMEAAKNKGLLWSWYPTSMSSSLNVIFVDSYKRALSFGISTDKHSTPAPEAMLTRASVAILLSFIVSPNWSNKFLNLELCCKVVMAVAGRAEFSSSSSSRSVQITTAATPFPLLFGSGSLWTSCWDSSRVPSLILWCTSLWSAQHSVVGCCT